MGGLLMQGVLGLRAQNMSGRKDQPPLPPSYVRVYSPGAYSWVCPANGNYRFVQWGAGETAGQSTTGGRSSAHAQTVRRLATGSIVTLAVGAAVGLGSPWSATIVTFPDGTNVTTVVGSTPTGGDIMFPGSAAGESDALAGDGLGDNGGFGGGFSGGAGAPGYGLYRGGDGGTIIGGVRPGQAPGGGGRAASTSPAAGGSGLVIVARE
jgi:hypothetical protein